MRVLILTQWFDPEPAPKGLGFAKSVAALGHHVEVLTGYPNYPGGKLYPGYRMRWRDRATIDGIDITRVPLYPSHDRSRIGRALNYVTFFMSSTWHLLFSVSRPDVIYCYHPPLTSGLAAAIGSRLRKVPLVYDIQDLWPDTLMSTGMIKQGRIVRLIGRLCKAVYRHADAITVLSEGFKKRLVGRGVPAEKLTVIHNWCEESRIVHGDAHWGPNRMPPGMDGKFNVVFAGTMGRAQALDAVLEAARVVAKQCTDVQFVFVGGGIEVERLKAAAKSDGNVLFMPPVPMDEVGRFLGRADATLVHLRDDPLFEITIPSKTQAYMAVGKPIIMAVRGDAAHMVKEAGAGIAATPEDANSIAAAVLELRRMSAQDRSAMGERGRTYYRNHLAMRVGVAKFDAIFRQIVRN